MFTGIVDSVGKVVELIQSESALRLWIDTGWSDPKWQLGESVSVNGACLTVVEFRGSRCALELSPETLQLTSLGSLLPASRVNLERALRLGDRLGGHWVLGHVDGLGKVARVEALGDCYRLMLELPEELAKYVVAKGSITVHGVSLTVNRVSPQSNQMELMLIPHTWKNTHFCDIHEGDLQHIEVDILAKHVERLVSPMMFAR